MDLATVFGITLGFGLIAGAILYNGSLMAFMNTPGALVVIGGTLAATLIRQKLSSVLAAFSVAKQAFLFRLSPVEELVSKLHELAELARKDGVLALEEVEVKDAFLARALVMAIDGLDADFVVSNLRRDAASLLGRHQRGQQVFRFMASTAPAMGMIGTLIGLVNMLQTLDDPASIGPAMAVALLTTFYGAVLAFLVFGPIAEKLEARTKEELLRRNLVIAGIESIICRHNKNLTQTHLDAYLAPRQREAWSLDAGPDKR